MHPIHLTKVGRWTVEDRLANATKTLKDGTSVLSSEQMTELELRAAITVLSEVELVGGDELKFARKAMGLKQTEFAEHLGVNAETVSRWETGADSFKRPVQLAVLHMLTEFSQTRSLTKPVRSQRGSTRVLRVRGVVPAR